MQTVKHNGWKEVASEPIWPSVLGSSKQTPWKFDFAFKFINDGLNSPCLFSVPPLGSRDTKWKWQTQICPFKWLFWIPNTCAKSWSLFNNPSYSPAAMWLFSCIGSEKITYFFLTLFLPTQALSLVFRSFYNCFNQCYNTLSGYLWIINSEHYN